MTSRDFVYWLQGYFEVSKATELGPIQTDVVKKHLALVFKHEIDPSMGSAEHQSTLDAIHDSSPASGTTKYRC